MRLLLTLLLFAGLLLAVSSGGGSSSSKKTAEITITGNCVGKETAVGVSIDGNAYSANVRVDKNGRGVVFGEADRNGLFKFTINETGTYGVEATGSRIKQLLTTLKIETCSTENFSCSTLTTMSERIRCRINIPEGQEQRLAFLPEECRTLNGTVRADCLKAYEFQQRCRHLEKDDGRDSCYLSQVGSVDTKEKILGYIKFRLYNLEEKTEVMREMGLITEDRAVEFITTLETIKAEFNSATDNNGRKMALLKAKDEWKRLVSDVRGKSG